MYQLETYKADREKISNICLTNKWQKKKVKFNSEKDEVYIPDEETLYEMADFLDDLGFEFYTFKECQDCDGSGIIISVVNFCSRPVSDCCGGCTETHYCDCHQGKHEIEL